MISSMHGTTAATIDPGLGGKDFLALDERMREAFSSGATAAHRDYADIVTMANDPAFLSDAGKLIELQVRLGDYRHQVELVSALARKGVSVAETLLRA